MKYRVAGASYTRREGSGENAKDVTYTNGQEIDVNKRELEAFPGVFTAIITPKTDADEAREQKLEADLKEARAQVTTLKAEVKRLETENGGLRTKPKEAQPSADGAQSSTSDKQK